ncbi:hypothetical protein [Sphingopyxis solisilvae]|uniref:hypothetical protein n=1 Tax=Sphingopyxis solisilvae TaxID=1886788 RepID=UPI0018928A02|nr:hypothetical protein [Sphingopyxis solisilvae]
MSNLWVWRHDGSLQCGLGEEEPLAEAQAQLATIIGAHNIVKGEKRQAPVMVIALCGAPTGQANAFELTEEGYYLLFHGFPGPIGFRPWIEPPAAKSGGASLAATFARGDGAQDRELRIVGSFSGDPTLIRELYGRPCRVYNIGDAITLDLRRNRFNVGLEEGRIKDLWFG